MTVEELVNGWKLNKVVLASKMDMPVSTFKNKLNSNLDQYDFSEGEQQQLIEVLRDLGADIETVAGISFNKALGELSKKEVEE